MKSENQKTKVMKKQIFNYTGIITLVASAIYIILGMINREIDSDYAILATGIGVLLLYLSDKNEN